MEDISSLVWIGIAIIWFLTRLVRRGAKKVARSQKKQSQPSVTPPAATRGTAPPTRIETPPSYSGRGGTGPPPIVPR